MRCPMILHAAILFVSAAAAQATSLCVSIDSDLERLRCYDRENRRRSVEFDNSISPRAEASPWAQRLHADAQQDTFELQTYRPNYLLYTRQSSVNRQPYAFVDPQGRLSEQEIKFQLSARFKLVDDLVRGNGDLWFGYSQTGYWQAFNSNISAPVREMNYEPEVHVSFLTQYSLLGFDVRGVNLGVWHQSNGRAEPLSRSWNRAFAEIHLARGAWSLSLKPWVRLESWSGEDNNPDIENYMGHYEARASWEKGEHRFSAMVRNVFSNGRYGAELSWSFRIAPRLRGIVQWYGGYGENLIDYDHNNHRIGVGIVVADWR